MIVAIVTPHSGCLELFREYETKAAIVMARHGGAIEQTIIEESFDPDQPIREVHIVSFPDSEAFHNYRGDPDLASLADLRAASVAHTELILGRDGPDYMVLSRSGFFLNGAIRSS